MARRRVDPLIYYRSLRRVIRYVDDHLPDPISVAQAARIACLSPKYFSRFFKQKAGIGFSDWLSAKRVERAKQLLVEKDHTITEIAAAVGVSERTLQRQFRRLVGLSPREYRRDALSH